ncbi:MAG: DUF167 domain-containing protein [Dehalococcoidia bacterium]|nr:DUF167 domain-containing protein [Dehalococcoidia bacterium]
MATAVRLQVRAQSGTRVDAFVRWEGAVLYLRVRALPVAGRANAAVEQLLARMAKLTASAVTVVQGASNRSKLVEFAGLTGGELRHRLRLNE